MEKGRKAFFIGKIPINRLEGGLSGRSVESKTFCLYAKNFFPKVPPGVFFSVKQTQYVEVSGNSGG